MSIPDFQSCMLPFLRVLSDGAEHNLGDVEESLGEHFKLSSVERAELLPSGQQRTFRNRIGWARTYLKKAALLESPRRGVFTITERGRKTSESNAEGIDIKYLEQFPEFMVFRGASKLENGSATAELQTNTTPEETIEAAHQGLRQQLADELLVRILGCSPTFFEQLVVELLVKMGYGGSRRDAGERIGQTGDGGIDGIIKEDRLGLDTICIQAKRWQGSVGRPDIQQFVGALQGRRAKKGVFITTSKYTAEAEAFVNVIDTKIVLIDGKQLAGLMIDFDIGVAPSATYVVKKIDSDYFDDS